LLLLLLDIAEVGCCGSGFVLSQAEFFLGSGYIGRGRGENISVLAEFAFETGELLDRLDDFGFGARGASYQFGATFFIVAATSGSAIHLQVDLVQAFASLPGF
jgi:hypothetical protein